MFKKILIGLVVLVAGFAVVVALQPSEFSVSRTATIAAPAGDVFGHVNDLRKWDAWSPWAKLDPNAKVGFEGPSAGKGAVFTWSGNDYVGEGRMTVAESRPAELVSLKVDFTMKETTDIIPQLSGYQIVAALPEDTVAHRRGKALFQKNCTYCHETSAALRDRFDQAGWEAIVSAMTPSLPPMDSRISTSRGTPQATLAAGGHERVTKTCRRR